jgi:hypothetical protein
MKKLLSFVFHASLWSAALGLALIAFASAPALNLVPTQYGILAGLASITITLAPFFISSGKAD